MATLKKYDFSGKEVGEIQIEDELLQHEAHGQMIKDYLVAIRKNQRQWSANTKQRAEVKCTGRKPHAQKGTGRARQGYFAAPQFRGGGIVFGPKPKFDMHTRINRKERQKVISYLLSQKVTENQVIVLERPQFDQPKTKKAYDFLKAMQLSAHRVLFLGECLPSEEEGAGWIKDREGLMKSLHNLKRAQFAQVPNINGYDLAKFRAIVLLEPAVEEFKAILGKKHGKKSV